LQNGSVRATTSRASTRSIKIILDCAVPFLGEGARERRAVVVVIDAQARLVDRSARRAVRGDRPIDRDTYDMSTLAETLLTRLRASPGDHRVRPLGRACDGSFVCEISNDGA
jgi:hypothetical protein